MNRAKALRESFNRTLRDVEADTGISRSSLQRIETEIGEPSYYAVERLADYYHVTIDYLMMHELPDKNEELDEQSKKVVETRLEIQRLMSELPVRIQATSRVTRLTNDARLPKKRSNDLQLTRKGIKQKTRFQVKEKT